MQRQILPERRMPVHLNALLSKNNFIQLDPRYHRNPLKPFLSITRFALLESVRIYFSTAIVA